MAKRIGTLDVIMGSMFAGKTEEIIRRIKRARIADKKVQVFKPKIDNRYSEDAIVTHSGESVKCEVVKNSHELFMLVELDTELIIIDEVQFFDDELIHYIRAIKRHMGIDIVVSGLDMWASGEPIPLVGKLACIANNVLKLKAVCSETGEDAYISHRIIDAEGDVVIGGAESYVALSEEAYLRAIGKLKE